MQCPKCAFENPSGVRYCLKCGSRIVPPVPEEKQPPLRQSRKMSLIALTLAMISLFALSGGAVLALLASQRAGRSYIVSSYSPEAAPYDPYLNEDQTDERYPGSREEQNPVYRFVDFESGILTFPDSGIKLTLPDFYDYSFEYDESKDLLIFEVYTNEGMTITFTSSHLNTSPYTKSEVESSQNPEQLYYEIKGEEDLYYYILPPSGPSANARIIDCSNSSSINITVFDQNYSYASEKGICSEPDEDISTQKSEPKEELDVQESSEETAEMFLELEEDDSSYSLSSESSSEEESSSRSKRTSSDSKDSSEKNSAKNSDSSDSDPETEDSVCRRSLNTLEAILDTAGISE